MSYLSITLGVGSITDAGVVLPHNAHALPEAIKNAVLTRDKNTCHYCGFVSQKYQEILFTGKDAGEVKKTDRYTTACQFCHQCFHLDKVERMQSGAIIWLPEIGQAALHHVCRAIYVARISRGPMADAARDAMEALLARKEEATSRLGTDSPRIVASILQDFLEVKEYRARTDKLKGFRLLPLDRRVIREGELEFNQFPQVLAYWRSKEGPFADMPARDWPGLFFDMRDAIKAA